MDTIKKGYLLWLQLYVDKQYQERTTTCETIEDVKFLIDVVSCFKEQIGSKRGFGGSGASTKEIHEKYIQIKAKHTNLSNSLKEEWQINEDDKNSYAVDCITQHLIGSSWSGVYWASLEQCQVFEIPTDLKNITESLNKESK
jgi:hypothetical protein